MQAARDTVLIHCTATVVKATSAVISLGSLIAAAARRKDVHQGTEEAWHCAQTWEGAATHWTFKSPMNYEEVEVWLSYLVHPR